MSEDMVTITRVEYDHLRAMEAQFFGYRLAVEALNGIDPSRPERPSFEWKWKLHPSGIGDPESVDPPRQLIVDLMKS